jgi:hypothetical protein
MLGREKTAIEIKMRRQNEGKIRGAYRPKLRGRRMVASIWTGS